MFHAVRTFPDCRCEWHMVGHLDSQNDSRSGLSPKCSKTHEYKVEDSKEQSQLYPLM